MICPKCTFSFFTRTYSTATKTRQVTCTICLYKFTAPLRTDLRREIKNLLTDCLFDDDVYKNGTTIERVQWMIDKLRSEHGHCND